MHAHYYTFFSPGKKTVSMWLKIKQTILLISKSGALGNQLLKRISRNKFETCNVHCDNCRVLGKDERDFKG
jgi:hypothetical protein